MWSVVCVAVLLYVTTALEQVLVVGDTFGDEFHWKILKFRLNEQILEASQSGYSTTLVIVGSVYDETRYEGPEHSVLRDLRKWGERSDVQLNVLMALSRDMVAKMFMQWEGEISEFSSETIDATISELNWGTTPERQTLTVDQWLSMAKRFGPKLPFGVDGQYIRTLNPILVHGNNAFIGSSLKAEILSNEYFLHDHGFLGAANSIIRNEIEHVDAGVRRLKRGPTYLFRKATWFAGNKRKRVTGIMDRINSRLLESQLLQYSGGDLTVPSLSDILARYIDTDDATCEAFIDQILDSFNAELSSGVPLLADVKIGDYLNSDQGNVLLSSDSFSGSERSDSTRPGVSETSKGNSLVERLISTYSAGPGFHNDGRVHSLCNDKLILVSSGFTPNFIVDTPPPQDSAVLTKAYTNPILERSDDKNSFTLVDDETSSEVQLSWLQLTPDGDIVSCFLMEFPDKSQRVQRKSLITGQTLNVDPGLQTPQHKGFMRRMFGRK